MKKLLEKYGKLIKYCLASISSFALDALCFYLFERFVFNGGAAWTDLACTVAARAISSFYNFNVNNRLVFGHKGDYGKALGRYYILAVPLMLASAGFVTLLDSTLGVTAPILRTGVKICVDTAIFLASYLIQKKWVFSEKRNGPSQPEGASSAGDGTGECPDGAPGPQEQETEE